MTRFCVGRGEGGPRMRLQLIPDSDSDQHDPTGDSYNSTETQRTFRSTDVPNGDQDLDNAVFSGRTPRNQSRVPPAITELGNNRAVNNVVNNGVKEEGSQVMTLSDPDVLDCPICLNPLSIPVYQVILQEDGGLLFIINNRKFQSLGNLITISCVQPSTSKKYSYTVVATIFECSLKMKSVADNMPTGVENVDWKNSLMVPQHYVDSLGELILDINIKNGCPQSPPPR